MTDKFQQPITAPHVTPSGPITVQAQHQFSPSLTSPGQGVSMLNSLLPSRHLGPREETHAV